MSADLYEETTITNQRTSSEEGEVMTPTLINGHGFPSDLLIRLMHLHADCMRGRLLASPLSWSGRIWSRICRCSLLRMMKLV